MSKKKIICLTPIKNESWILDKFISAASLWADHIIIADQNSTDNSRQIAKKFKKVILIENNNSVFDEKTRKDLLLVEAKKIDGEKILISLDADEFLSSNFQSEKEWEYIHSLRPGTIIEFPWINIYPTLDKYWFADNKPFGFVYDNNGEPLPGTIHIERLPMPKNSPRYRMNKVFTMHFQYVDWDRMESKHRWYQCWERINRPRSAVEIFRMYHHMYAINNEDLKQIPKIWFDVYDSNQIDLRSINKQKEYWWDSLVLDYIEKYGHDYFKKEAIWKVDWNRIALSQRRNNVTSYSDPRNVTDRIVQYWLRKTQRLYNRSIFVKGIDYILTKIIKY